MVSLFHRATIKEEERRTNHSMKIYMVSLFHRATINKKGQPQSGMLTRPHGTRPRPEKHKAKAKKCGLSTKTKVKGTSLVLTQTSFSAHAHRKIFGRPFVKRFALCYRTVVCLSCLFVCSVCDVGVLWPNDSMDQDETWHGGRPRSRSHCVRWGPSSPQKGHSHPQFLAHFHCGQTARGIKICHLVWR